MSDDKAQAIAQMNANEAREEQKDGINCCDHFWPFVETENMNMDVHSGSIAVCLICGGYESKSSGQMDIEEAWNTIGTDEDEIKDELMTQNPEATKEQIDSFIDDTTEEYKKVVKELYKGWAQ